jgi:hypothetical protein
MVLELSACDTLANLGCLPAVVFPLVNVLYLKAIAIGGGLDHLSLQWTRANLMQAPSPQTWLSFSVLSVVGCVSMWCS